MELIAQYIDDLRRGTVIPGGNLDTIPCIRCMAHAPAADIECYMVDLHLDMDYKNLVKKIEVENPKDTRILSISAQDPDAEMAKKIVDTTAEVASDYVGEIMEMTPPKLIESGEVAVKKTSPSNTKNAAIGALIAAFLVCAYISLTVILNDTIQSEEDVEKYLELPVLAVIPESKIHGRGEKKVKRTSGIWDIINPFAGKEKNERR